VYSGVLYESPALSFESLQSQDWVHDTAMRREETFLDNIDTDRKPATFLPTTTATEITTTTRSVCCLVTTIYIRLSRVSTTYTYEDIYTRVGRYLPQRRIKGGTQVLENERGQPIYKGVTTYILQGWE
jgi:hypothetical protein